MADGFIKDFQISASSEHPSFPATNGRPRGTGWCALSDDTNPYIQVGRLSAQYDPIATIQKSSKISTPS